MLCNHLLEVLTNGFLIDQELVLRNIGYFQEHRCYHVDAVKLLQVYLHVERNLTLLFLLFEL